MALEVKTTGTRIFRTFIHRKLFLPIHKAVTSIAKAVAVPQSWLCNFHVHMNKWKTEELMGAQNNNRLANK